IDDALVWVAGITHQPQFNRDLAQIGGADAARIGDDAQHVLFAEVGRYVNRVEPQDCRERRRLVTAYQRTNGGQMGRHAAVERRRHLGIAQLDLGQLQRGLRLLYIGALLIAVLLRFVELGLPAELGRLAKGILPLELRFGVLQRGLRARELGFRLLDFRLVRRGLDDEEDVAGLRHGAIFVVDFTQKARDPCDELHFVEADGVAGQFEIARYRPLHRLRHPDLGGWWRLVFVFFIAGGQNRQQENTKGGLIPAEKVHHVRPRALLNRRLAHVRKFDGALGTEHYGATSRFAHPSANDQKSPKAALVARAAYHPF